MAISAMWRRNRGNSPQNQCGLPAPVSWLAATSDRRTSAFSTRPA